MADKDVMTIKKYPPVFFARDLPAERWRYRIKIPQFLWAFARDVPGPNCSHRR